MLRPISYVLGLFGLMTLLAACETMEGAGRDLENAGEAIQEESAEAQAEM
jgi:entericidin B